MTRLTLLPIALLAAGCAPVHVEFTFSPWWVAVGVYVAGCFLFLLRFLGQIDSVGEFVLAVAVVAFWPLLVILAGLHEMWSIGKGGL